MYSRCSWLGECVVVTVCCVVCVIEYGWYVGRGDCGVCGWKDRCRDGNLRTYCHVSRAAERILGAQDNTKQWGLRWQLVGISAP